MEINFLTQPKEGKLGDIIKNRLKEGFDEVHIIAGMAKDTGFEDILTPIEEAASSTNINCYIGIDRKNTSKDMLSKLLSAGVTLHIHINTDSSKVESRIYIFESKEASSYIYSSGGKFSSSGLFESISTIIEIKYDSSDDDKKAFRTAKNSILQGTTNIFHNIDQEEIILLAEKGEISARITERKIPSISEIYGASQSFGPDSDNSPLLGERVYDESTSTSTIDLNSLEDIDIDFEPEISVRMNVQLEAEKEAKKEQQEKENILKSLKKTANDLDKFYDNELKNKDTKKNATIHMSTEPDYQNMTTLIIECNKILEKGVGAGEFKIPKALAENLSSFLGTENNTFASLEVFDNASGKTETDFSAELIISDKGMSIKSTLLNALKPEEGDIIRLLKEEDNKFRCEIIRKNTPEYDIWQCYCINTLKGNKRKFGII